MKLRTFVLIVAGAGIPLALVAMLLPITWGYGGFNWNFQPSGPPKVIFVDPNGPAARAGMHRGDIVRPLRGYGEILEVSGPTGTRIVEHLIHNGKPVTATITFTPFSGALAAQEVLNKFLFGFTALIAFAMAILVTLRARDPNVGLRGALILIAAGAAGFTQEAALVCGNAWAALIFARTLPPVLAGAALWAALALLAIYPPQRNAVRKKLVYAGWVAFGWGCVSGAALTWSYYSGTTAVLDLPVVRGPVAWVFDAVLCFAIADAVAKAATTYAVPVRWLGVGLFAGIAIGAIPDIALVGDLGWGFHSTDILRAASSFCIVFGVAYPVLRHRLLDLNLVISRAAIFSVVSLLLLGVFALAEWILADVLEQMLGSAFDTRGRTALAASVALLLGLSAGSIHRLVEHRLNRVFFARRYRALEHLHRFALEADVATDSSALLEVTLRTMRRNLDTQFVALYVGRPELGYVSVGTTASIQLPLRLDQNEEVILRLRRWGEAFVVDNNPEHPLANAYVAPMMLRGTLYGFAICGPKADRTSYLPDECEVVAALVHRVGIAYEWLTRGGADVAAAAT